MKWKLTFAMVLLLAAFTFAHGGDEEPLDQLKARAAAAKPGDQPKLFLQIAERDLKLASDLYNHGDIDKGRATVEDLATSCESATTAARESGKHLKQSEVKMREIARRLDALKKTLSFDDRPPVQAAIDRLEKLRTELLARMFGPKP